MPARSSDEFRVGVIGFGLAGSVFHAPFISRTPGLHLAAIVTRNADRRQRIEREYPGAAVVESVTQLLAMTPKLDLVVVASPNGEHAAHASQALDAGMNVVIDKPFATSAAEARRLVTDARARKLLVIPFHNRRWDGDFLTIRRLLADGELGDLWRFESRFERWRATPKPRWTQPDALRNGEDIVFDIGAHLVDHALVLGGPVTSVYAEIDRRQPGVVLGDDALLALTHANGVRSRLYASAVAARPSPRFLVFGSKGAYIKYGLDPQEHAMIAGSRPGNPGWGEDVPERYGQFGLGDDVRVVRTERGCYERYYAGVAAALAGQAPPPVSPEDAIAGLDIIEAAHRSASEGRVVTGEWRGTN